MSATFGIVGTNPLTDFTSGDLEDLIYKDIGNKWTLTGDLSKTNIFGTTVQADMVNRPNQFRPAWIWVQHRRTASSRTTETQPSYLGGSIGKTGYIGYLSTFYVRIFYKRLTTPGLTFPELGQMAMEVGRILYQYPQSNPEEIPGVRHFDNWVMENIEEASTFGEAFRGWYQMICTIDAAYQKHSTI